MAAAAQVGPVVSARWLALAGLLGAPLVHAAQYYVIIAGLGGEPRYEQRFEQQADLLKQAAVRTTGSEERVIVLAGAAATREAVRAKMRSLARTVAAGDSVAVFLIGHGSYDGEHYKFNLPGPDIDGAEFAQLLGALPARSQLVVNASSASGAVVDGWKAPGRVLITATKSGAERNATRFAEHWAAALSSDEADANKNGVITAAEAYEYAARKVADSFEAEGTLATEHAQLAGEDGTHFEASRLQARVAATAAQQQLMTEHDRLEAEIESLRQRKDQMASDEYLDALQDLLLQLALVQRQIDAAGAGGP
jgi:hypothetical protein